MHVVAVRNLFVVAIPVIAFLLFLDIMKNGIPVRQVGCRHDSRRRTKVRHG